MMQRPTDSQVVAVQSAVALYFTPKKKERKWKENAALVILGAVWFTKCNINGNGNASHSSTSDNEFE